MNTAKHVLFLVMLSFLALLAGCEEDTINPPTGTTDTIAPFVTRTIPALFDIGIAVDAPIIITFSEAINPATLDRSISISSGDITGITPISTSQYRIDHTPWNEGVQVSVALGTGITDTAGNALATDFLISFWTTTTDVLLLNTLPAHKAVDVSRNSQVRLRFSSRMDSLSLAGAMNISTGTRKTIGVRAMEIQDDWVILSFNEPLPASTRITITIASSAMDIDGRPLAAPVLYFFTTGIDLDRSAPTILSFEPANGAIITADLQFLRVTFSEPIDDTHFVPSVFSGSFAMELFRVGADPVWTKNYTVLTIPLSGMMPAGAIIFLGFDSFSDLNGNTNPSGFSYRLTIEGEPDLFPVVDG